MGLCVFDDAQLLSTCDCSTFHSHRKNGMQRNVNSICAQCKSIARQSRMKCIYTWLNSKCISNEFPLRIWVSHIENDFVKMEKGKHHRHAMHNSHSKMFNGKFQCAFCWLLWLLLLLFFFSQAHFYIQLIGAGKLLPLSICFANVENSVEKGQGIKWEKKEPTTNSPCRHIYTNTFISKPLCRQ